MSWLVLDMDDGLLRREPTRRAAVQWLLGYGCADRVKERHTYGPGHYSYTVWSGDPYDSCDRFISDEKRLRRQLKEQGHADGWDVDQVALFPLRDQPYSRVERVDTSRVWNHNRKGLVRGVVVREDDTWMWIKLVGDHQLYYYSQAWREAHLIDSDGDVLQLRKSLMTEVQP